MRQHYSIITRSALGFLLAVICINVGAVGTCAEEEGPADGDVPAQLVKISGDTQTGPASQQLPQPLVVEVRNLADRAIPGIEIHFTVTKGGGSLSADTVISGMDGRASSHWTLGPTPGTDHEVTVRAATGSATAVTFTATAT